MSTRDPFPSTSSSTSTDPLTSTDPVTWENDDYVDPTQTGMAGKAQEKAGDLANKASEMTGAAQDKASDMASHAQQKASEIGGTAQEKADAGMDAAASGLGQAADMLRSQGEQHEGTLAAAATRTADTLDSASYYLREKDTDQLLNDVEAFVRQRPVESVLIAAGVGFVLSRLVR